MIPIVFGIFVGCTVLLCFAIIEGKTRMKRTLIFMLFGGLLAGATIFAGAAKADGSQDQSFVLALSNSGFAIDDMVGIITDAQTACAAAHVTGNPHSAGDVIQRNNSRLSYQQASDVTLIAVSIYCPDVLSWADPYKHQVI